MCRVPVPERDTLPVPILVGFAPRKSPERSSGMLFLGTIMFKKAPTGITEVRQSQWRPVWTGR